MDVLVFGSNRQARHGAGGALEARLHWGASPKIAEGLSGRSYAIPTKETPYKTLPLSEVAAGVERFKPVAVAHPEWRFLLTKIGCGLAGFSEPEIAPLFADCGPNVVLIDEKKQPICLAAEWHLRV